MSEWLCALLGQFHAAVSQQLPTVDAASLIPLLEVSSIACDQINASKHPLCTGDIVLTRRLVFCSPNRIVLDKTSATNLRSSMDEYTLGIQIACKAAGESHKMPEAYS